MDGIGNKPLDWFVEKVRHNWPKFGSIPGPINEALDRAPVAASLPAALSVLICIADKYVQGDLVETRNQDDIFYNDCSAAQKAYKSKLVPHSYKYVDGR